MHMPNIYHILKRRWLKANIKKYGHNCCIHYSCKISNGKYILLGENIQLGEGSKILIWDKYERSGLKSQQIFEPSLEIGNNFSATRDLTIQCTGKMIIGNDVTVASNVFICDENHGINPLISNYLDQPLNVKNISIGNGVSLSIEKLTTPVIEKLTTRGKIFTRSVVVSTFA